MNPRIAPGQRPAAVPAVKDGAPCHKCPSLCCRYFALEIDEPEDEEDFESLRWYLLHERSWIWVDDGDWYLQIDNPCRALAADGSCADYKRRPSICREYGTKEFLDHPDDPLCDYFGQGESHDLEFREPAEITVYAKRFLARKEAERKRRSAAARKGWKKRRARKGS